MNLKKEIENMQKDLKNVKDALGLGNETGKNIKMLLDTIRLQGDQFKNMDSTIQQLTATNQIYSEFLESDKDIQTQFMKYAQEIAAKRAEEQRAQAEAMKNPIALEFKEKPKITDYKKSKQISGPIVEKPTEIPGRKVTQMPPPEVDGVAHIQKDLGKIQEPKPKDKHGKIVRK